MGNIILPMWAQCPAMTRTIVVGYPVMSMILMFLGSTPVSWLINFVFVCNIRTVMHLCLWTLFVGPFFSPIASGMSFLFTLFEIYMVMMYFPSREQELGSMRLLLWTLFMNALVNIFFLFVNLCFSFYYSKNVFMAEMYMQQTNHGLWPIVMVVLTLRCLSDPQGSTSFWGLVQVPNKWYPICLTAFFCLLSGMRILWNFVAALAVGYTYHIVNYERLMPSRVFVNKMEQRCCSSNNAGCLGGSWIPVTQTSGYDTEVSRQRYGDNNSNEMESRNRGSASNFQVFSGSGNRLGEDTSDLAQPLAPPGASAAAAPSDLPPASAPANADP